MRGALAWVVFRRGDCVGCCAGYACVVFRYEDCEVLGKYEETDGGGRGGGFWFRGWLWGGV